jgi:polyhydroxyalkanoate synthase
MITLASTSLWCELEVFIDEDQIEALESARDRAPPRFGDGRGCTTCRSNDLIWSFVINNYLMGRDPFPFDLLHWNCDSTRMPAKMHSFYLRNMYMKNALKTPNGITLADTPSDVGRIALPTYFASAMEDHIAPWKATYAGRKLLGGKSRRAPGRSTSPE